MPKRNLGPDYHFGVLIWRAGLKTSVGGDLSAGPTAAGFVRVKGEQTPLRGGGTGDCDSGKLPWAANP